MSQLAALKCMGVFAAQASIVPTRSIQFFKDVCDHGIPGQIVAIIKEAAGSAAKPKALHKVAV